MTNFNQNCEQTMMSNQLIASLRQGDCSLPSTTDTKTS